MNRFKRSVKYAVLLIFMIACSFSGIAPADAAERQQPQPVSIEQIVKKQSLQVSETAEKKPNVTGSIQKGKKKIEKGGVQIVGGSDSGELYYEAEIKKGTFSLYLPDGSYVVEGYWDQTGMFISCNYSFTVVKGKSNPSPLKIVIPADNVKGNIEKAGKKVASGILFISSENDEIEDSYFAEIRNGQFNLYLPDGVYVVDGYIDSKGVPVSINYSFTVVKGKSNPSPLKIVIPAENVKGSIQKAGKKVASGILFISDEGSKEEYSYFAGIENGQFSLYLPDGSYTVEGYTDDEGAFVSLNYSFTVAKGKSNPSPLKIIVPADNVKGTIEKAGKKVASGSVTIRDINDKKEKVYFTEIENGKFSLYLTDGSYTVEGYTDDEKPYVPLNYSFTVVKGKSNPSPLKIIIPADNVKGSVQKAGKKVKSGSITIRDVKSKEDNPYFAEVQNGQFSLYLPDGSYIVEEYMDDEGNVVPLTYSFTVAKGKSNPSSLKITVPSDNVKGSVRKSSGEKVASGTVIIRGTSGKKDVYFTEIENGQFSLYLSDGKYEVIEYIDPVSDGETILKYAFTVAKGKSNPALLDVKLSAAK